MSPGAIVVGLFWALVFDVFLVGGCWIAVHLFPNEGGKAGLTVLLAMALLGAAILLLKRGESK